MNINKKRVLSIIGLLFGGVIIGGIAGAYIMTNFIARIEEGNFAIEQSAEIARNVDVLERIRSGETDKAAELIETALDSNLMFFSRDHNFDKKIDKLALIYLRRASEYRAKYPRTTKIKEIDEALSKALSRQRINEK